jgi:hypothetical protein
MIINSPVGRFPFKATTLQIRSGRLRLEGDMGTWPTSVEVQFSELPRILGGLLPVRSTVVFAGAIAAGTVVARRRWLRSRIQALP